MTYFIQFKSSNGMFAFGSGEITEEMIAACPADSKLIPITSDAPVTLMSDRRVDGEPLDLWLIVYLEDGEVRAKIIQDGFIGNAIAYSQVLSDSIIRVEHIFDGDIERGAPFFVSA